ncbi:replication initiation protein, partial [Escherichia coli]|nr:replication initiation protein [Escherichia coli]
VRSSQKEITTTPQTAFHQMTDAQINMFGNQLSRLPEFSNLANGNESYDSLAAKIKELLRDPIQQKQFLPHLKNLGFK